MLPPSTRELSIYCHMMAGVVSNPAESPAIQVKAENDGVLKLLCWNIDGLDNRDVKDRADSVCKIIMEKRPHVVYLQEVVDLSWVTVIVASLSHLYSCFCPSKPPHRYYNAILVLKGSVDVIGSGLQFYDFHSRLGRHLLQLSIRFSGVELEVMTSHLESMEWDGDERVRQLKMVFEKMTESQQSNRPAIFGGDLNITDEEVERAKVPEGFVDVWEACGKPAHHQYTFDYTMNDNRGWPSPNSPKSRIDRIYLSPGGGTVRPMTFELVGKDKINGRFPSDHWGVWMEFDVKRPQY